MATAVMSMLMVAGVGLDTITINNMKMMMMRISEHYLYVSHMKQIIQYDAIDYKILNEFSTKIFEELTTLSLRSSFIN